MDATKPLTISKQRVMEFTGAKGGWGRLLDGSGVSREAPAPFCEGPGVQFPRPTHHQGFNTQKHHGYALKHKYARGSWRAAKNYYQCLQIGHLINQLMILSTTFQPLLQGKITCRHLWQAMVAFLLYGHLSHHHLESLAKQRIQIRFT